MDDRPPTGPSETAARAKAEGQRVANAFLEVFGAGSRRSESARTVLAYLGSVCGEDQNSYRLYEARDGIGAIAAGLHRDGAKSILNIIHRQVLLATTVTKVQKPTATVRKA